MVDLNKSQPKFCNAAIKRNYSDTKLCLMVGDFQGAFACWVARQNPNADVKVIDKALEAWTTYVEANFNNVKIPEYFTYTRLDAMITEQVFFAIPEIRVLNEMKPDFIDLGALARNVFYMIVRDYLLEENKLA